MQILLTNDDGIFAPGLAAIYKELVRLGDVAVVAPSDSQSGMGHSVTVTEPLLCNKVDINGQFTGYSVAGSPADCVKLAIMQLLTKPIDLVVSGINSGANVGVNVYYSGTVAAAMEAAFFKVPAVAISLAADDRMDFESAARYHIEIIKKLLPLTGGKVININVPQLSKGSPKGIKVVPQSTRGFDEQYSVGENEQGQKVYQLTGGLHRHEEAVTDTISLGQGFITITALRPDMTHHSETKKLEQIEW